MNMHIRFRHDRQGGHTRLLVFIGKDVDHLQKSGELVVDNDQWEILQAIIGNGHEEGSGYDGVSPNTGLGPDGGIRAFLDIDSKPLYEPFDPRAVKSCMECRMRVDVPIGPSGTAELDEEGNLVGFKFTATADTLVPCNRLQACCKDGAPIQLSEAQIRGSWILGRCPMVGDEELVHLNSDCELTDKGGRE
jgi:hypothetical protein